MLERKIDTHDVRNMPRAGKVVEKRESHLGTTLLFEDFMNYKAQLAALPQFPASGDVSSVAKQEMVDASSPTSWAFPIEGTVPESCLVWSAIEDELKKSIQTSGNSGLKS
jgi:hypothetical protein